MIKPILITVRGSPRLDEILAWSEKNLPSSSVNRSLPDIGLFAFGNDEDWMLWRMMWSGSHHHHQENLWVHTKTQNDAMARHKASQAAKAAAHAAGNATTAALAAQSDAFGNASFVATARTSTVLHPVLPKGGGV